MCADEIKGVGDDSLPTSSSMENPLGSSKDYGGVELDAWCSKWKSVSFDGLKDESGELQGKQFHSAIRFLFGAVGLPLVSSALASRFSSTW